MQAKGRSWSRDPLLPAKFLLETLVAGAAVFIPLATRDTMAITLGVVVLAIVLFHDKRLIVKPQMEPLL